MSEHIRDLEQQANDSENENVIRPSLLRDFIGQEKLKQNLHIFISAAKSRGEALDHVLFYGPPGLGKTTLSQIIAQELNVGIKVTSGPMLSKTGELAAILTNLEHNDVLFIDEIHRLNPSVEELLYPAMEDYCIDLVIGSGPAARSVKINLPKFTLVGATTRLGLLTNPLRDRFGIPVKLDFYDAGELLKIILRGAKIFEVQIEKEAAEEIARCSRGTPRIAIRLLKRIRDFAQYQNKAVVNADIVKNALNMLGIDVLGLDALDYKYIRYIADYYGGGPVGIETIVAGLSEDRDTIEDAIEPYLMQIGFINRTTRGRVITAKCMEYFGINNVG
ncbi:Holliday junction branch migration DNA helicase RuvB [Candidatus Lariskella endosymbiont of Hedychridium roseum]|uniref:Holliday junction branch migration DNA helicase RuvB n=1 Tax=Candidatus Lariskella endosymbiont of Hedychridium roseum TaxID=3077949 RepID=UPI0030D611AF